MQAVDEPRVKPEGDDDWYPVAKEVFNDDTNGILFTDGAVTYSKIAQICKGIKEVHQVNHQQKIFAQAVVCLADTSKEPGVAGRMRDGMAGTMSIDSEWGRLKKEFPPGRLAGSTAEGKRQAVRYLRSAQWKRMVAMEDRWAAFCGASRDYRVDASTRKTFPLVKERLRKSSRNVGVDAVVPTPAPKPPKAEGCELVGSEVPSLPPSALPDDNLESALALYASRFSS